MVVTSSNDLISSSSSLPGAHGGTDANRFFSGKGNCSIIKASTVKETVEVKYVSTSDVCVFPNRVVIGSEPVTTNYAITNLFSVNGVEWIIRSICPVVSTSNYQQTYNEQLHKEYNDLVLRQADELFNCLARSEYNKVTLGIKNRFGQYGDSSKCGSGYVFDNSIDLYFTIGDSCSSFKTDEEHIPYIKVYYRDWSLG